MTSSSWEHQREVRDALRTIVTDPQLGVPALSSAQTMSNLLKDLLPDAPRETSVLVAAAEAGLAQVLLDHVGQGMDVATASSVTASAFAARTPFTTDACNWAVAELGAALDLAPASPAGPPPGGFRPATQAPTVVAGGPAGHGLPPRDRAETILPRRNAGARAAAGAGAGWAAPGYGAVPAGGAGYACPPPAAPAAPAAGPGYAYLPPTTPATGPGQAGLPRPGRRVPRAWMILTGAVVLVALIGGIVALVRHSPNSRTTIEPLSQLIKPDVVSCRTTSALGLRGLTHREDCTTHESTIKLIAYQFGTSAEYAAGLSRLNDITGWISAAAGTSCPPPVGGTHGRTLWHSNVNAKFGPRSGQILECYAFNHDPGYLFYLWTLPTQRVILLGSEGVTVGTFADLEKWWAGLGYG